MEGRLLFPLFLLQKKKRYGKGFWKVAYFLSFFFVINIEKEKRGFRISPSFFFPPFSLERKKDKKGFLEGRLLLCPLFLLQRKQNYGKGLWKVSYFLSFFVIKIERERRGFGRSPSFFFPAFSLEIKKVKKGVLEGYLLFVLLLCYNDIKRKIGFWKVFFLHFFFFVRILWLLHEKMNLHDFFGADFVFSVVWKFELFRLSWYFELYFYLDVNMILSF